MVLTWTAFAQWIDMNTPTLARLFIAGSLLALPMIAGACASERDNSIEVRRWTPVIKAGDKPPALQQNIIIRSAHAYLIPEGATANVVAIRQGSIAPLQLLTDETVKRIQTRLRFLGDDGPTRPQRGKRWLYVYAGSYGKSELHLSDATGWNQVVQLGMVYRQPEPSGEPIPLGIDGSEPVSFDLGADNNTLWLSVQGSLQDRWSMVEGADTSLELVRIERLAVPDGDPERVGLFFVGSRSMTSGMIRIEGSNAPGKVFRFKVHAQLATTC